MDLSKLTGPQRANYHYMADAMRRLEWDLHHHIEATGRVPREWQEIAKDKTVKAKVQLTIRLDEDVVRFLKSMRRGISRGSTRCCAAICTRGWRGC